MYRQIYYANVEKTTSNLDWRIFMVQIISKPLKSGQLSTVDWSMKTMVHAKVIFHYMLSEITHWSWFCGISTYKRTLHQLKITAGQEKCWFRQEWLSGAKLIQWNLSIADMLYGGHLSIGDTFSFSSFSFSNYYLKLWSNLYISNLSIADTSL